MNDRNCGTHYAASSTSLSRLRSLIQTFLSPPSSPTSSVELICQISLSLSHTHTHTHTLTQKVKLQFRDSIVKETKLAYNLNEE
jgi:hypothetical protein